MDDAFLITANRTSGVYVDEPGNGLPHHNHHTQEFNNGYAKGWCSVMGRDTETETDNADFACEMVLSH